MKRDKLLFDSLILLLAFGLRVWGLATAICGGTRDFQPGSLNNLPLQLIERTASDVHPPLYYLLLHLWQEPPGPSSHRDPFVAAGVLGVAFPYKLAAAFGDRTPAGWRASFWLSAAVCGRLVAGDAVATWALWTTLGLWAAWGCWQTNRWRYWVVYVLACVAALWTLYLTVTLLVITNVALLPPWQHRRWNRSLLLRWIAAQVAVVALFVPWLLFMVPRVFWLVCSRVVFTCLLSATLCDDAGGRRFREIERFLLPTLAVMAILVAVTIPAWRRSRGGDQTLVW